MGDAARALDLLSPTVRIADPRDPRLDDYRDVKDPEWVRRRDLFLAEGRLVVRRLLAASRFRVRSLLTTQAAWAELAGYWGDRPEPVYEVDRSTLDAVAGARFHQGCVAAAERPIEPTLPELLKDEQRCWMVLENVSDPDNIGGIFRNAHAFGVDAVALGPGCSHPLYRKATRTSLGATLEVPFAWVPEWPRDLDALRQAGFLLLALTPRADADDIGGLDRPERFALVLGDEGYGLSEEVLAFCDRRVRIAMASGADSVNVATASGIALHRLAPAQP